MVLRERLAEVQSQVEILRRLHQPSTVRRYTLRERFWILYHMSYFDVPRRRGQQTFGVARSTFYRWLRRIDGNGESRRIAQLRMHTFCTNPSAHPDQTEIVEFPPGPSPTLRQSTDLWPRGSSWAMLMTCLSSCLFFGPTGATIPGCVSSFFTRAMSPLPATAVSRGRPTTIGRTGASGRRNLGRVRPGAGRPPSRAPEAPAATENLPSHHGPSGRVGAELWLEA
jgi:hypothetical protein